MIPLLEDFIETVFKARTIGGATFYFADQLAVIHGALSAVVLVWALAAGLPVLAALDALAWLATVAIYFEYRNS